MKNQLDLITRMSGLMDAIQNGTVDVDRASAMIKAADVIVEVMKTEAVLYRISDGDMQPSFIQSADHALAAPAGVETVGVPRLTPPPRINEEKRLGLERPIQPSAPVQQKSTATPLDEKEYQQQERARIAAEKQQRMARLGRV